MSWEDQGRQEHGWFGHGTAGNTPTAELGSRAFAIVDLAGEALQSGPDAYFPVEKTTAILRTLAPTMAPHAGLAPNAFRRRFFRESFDPVDAWTIQQAMQDVAGAGDHASLVRAGHALAATMGAMGPQEWRALLGRTVAAFAPATPSAYPGPVSGVEKAQYSAPVPFGPLPLVVPPSAVPTRLAAIRIGTLVILTESGWMGAASRTPKLATPSMSTATG